VSPPVDLAFASLCDSAREIVMVAINASNRIVPTRFNAVPFPSVDLAVQKKTATTGGLYPALFELYQLAACSS
jgi:hypothetical protein